MSNEKITIHNRNLEARKKSLSSWKIPKQEKKEVLEFLDKSSLGQVNKGKRISKTNKRYRINDKI